MSLGFNVVNVSFGMYSLTAMQVYVRCICVIVKLLFILFIEITRNKLSIIHVNALLLRL